MLFSVAARMRGVRDAVYADLTWVGFVGERVPDEAQHLFAIARDARAAAVALVADRAKKKLPVRGFELDDAARAVAAKAGFGDRVLRPTGHAPRHAPLRRRPHASTTPSRATSASSCRAPATSSSPASTSPAPSACASPLDLFLAPDGPHLTPEPPQQEIELIR